MAQPAFAPAHVAIVAPSDADAQLRIAALEAKVAEQDATIRRVLAMLIDWAEKDLPQTLRKAA